MRGGQTELRNHSNKTRNLQTTIEYKSASERDLQSSSRRRLFGRRRRRQPISKAYINGRLYDIPRSRRIPKRKRV